MLHEERFVDEAPATVYARLLDEGVYLCSEATMYRVLREHGEVRERRAQATHPATVSRSLSTTMASNAAQIGVDEISRLADPAVTRVSP